MYILVHYVDEPSKSKILNCINQIMFDFDVFDMSGIEPHFTLKYYFEKEYLEKIEAICQNVSEKITSGNYKITTIGDFSKETIFLNLELDSNSKKVYNELFSRIKEFKIPFGEHEQNGIHFHITLAQQTKKEFSSILKFLQKQNFHQTQKLSNLTILHFNGKEFTIHKQYELQNQ